MAQQYASVIELARDLTDDVEFLDALEREITGRSLATTLLAFDARAE